MDASQNHEHSMEARGAGKLGQIVSWKVPSTVLLWDLRKALQESGLNPDLAQDMEDRNALSRALREMSKGRVIRKLKREGDVLHFQLTKETITAHSADYDYEAMVRLDVKSGDLSGDSFELTELARKLLDDHKVRRITNDLTRLVQGIFEKMRADLVPIREQGGAYFVPAQHEWLTNQVREFLRQIGGKLRSFTVRLGCGDTSESVADSMAEYLRDLLTEFEQRCATLWDGSRTDVKAHRLQELSEVRRKLEGYRSIMGAFADTIEGRIASADRTMMEALAREAAPTVGEVAEASVGSESGEPQEAPACAA